MEKIVLLSGMLLVSAFCFVTKTVESQQGKPAALSYKFSVNIGKQEVVPPIQPEQATEESPAKATQPAVETLEDTVIQFRNIRFEHTNQDMSDREMTANDDKGNAFYFKIVADKLTAVKVNGDEVPDNQIANYQEVFRQADIAWNQASIKKQQLIAADRLKSSQERALYLNALKQAQKEKNDRKTEGFVKATNAYAGKEKFSINKEKEFRVEKDKTNFNKNSNENTPARDVLGVKKMPVPKDISADQERVRGIIAELVKEKILADPASIEWFGLSENELIVNGRKQSTELQQKLRQKYNISTGNGLYYGDVKMTGIGIFLDKDDI
jgi:bla regulator protein BlaR1